MSGAALPSATVGIAVTIPWRYADNAPVVNWLLDVARDTLPDYDLGVLQRTCQLKWCFVPTNGMLRRRRQSAAEFKELLRDLAKMLVAASPTLNAEPEPKRRLRQELHLAQFLCEEVAAHLDDTSFLKAEPEPAEESAKRTGKDAASAENTPAAEDSQDEGRTPVRAEP